MQPSSNLVKYNWFLSETNGTCIAFPAIDEIGQKVNDWK